VNNSHPPGRLAGKTAVVTGSTAGIGRGIAERFAREGASVVVSGRNDDRGHAVTDGIVAAGGTAVYLQADVGDGAAIEHLVGFAVETYGRLDIMVNNAHSGKSGTITDMDEAAWDRHLSVALRSVFLGCRSAVLRMLEHGTGGSLINVSSSLGMRPGRRNASYSTAKAAIINLTRSIAVDFAEDGIRANTLSPSWIIVREMDEYLTRDPEILGRNGAVYPLRRPGLPEDVANAALFLASDEASFITGHNLVVDGGLTAQLPEAVVDPLGDYFRDLIARGG
jgi:NAD(P)-dependent dehydrogenase (short-subunit alcohol dehydrogenase family)